MRYPPGTRAATEKRLALRHQCKLLVAHGPREWAWMQVNAWGRMREWIGVVCMQGTDPLSHDWTLASRLDVLVLGVGEQIAEDCYHDPDESESQRLIAALMNADARDITGINMANAARAPAHFHREGTEWLTWSGLGPREQTKRHRVTVETGPRITSR